MMPLEIGPVAPSRRLLKKGIEFNLMLVGESGLGKSTLINALFNNNPVFDRDSNKELLKTVEINRTTIEIEEPGTKIRLTIIDTPGFGDGIDNDNSCDPILNYVDSQLMKYYKDESGLNRKSIVDDRVHCCLYFIAPNHRGLAPLDIKFMRKLQDRVNLIPIVCKADSYTNKELTAMKLNILNDIRDNEINIYQFPICDEDDDPDFIRINEEFKKLVPFSVISSVDTKAVKQSTIRIREYPWGVIDIDDPTSSDFTYLRTMLLKTHINDFRDHTAEIHYENFRTMLISGGIKSTDVLSTIPDQKVLHIKKISQGSVDKIEA